MAFIKKTPPHVYLFIYFYYYLVNYLGKASNTINGTKWLSLKKTPPYVYFFSSRADNVSFVFILFINYYLVNNRSLTMTRNLSRTRLLPRTLPPLW
jgi:hypothetical protein